MCKSSHQTDGLKFETKFLNVITEEEKIISRFHRCCMRKHLKKHKTSLPVGQEQKGVRIKQWLWQKSDYTLLGPKYRCILAVLISGQRSVKTCTRSETKAKKLANSSEHINKTEASPQTLQAYVREFAPRKVRMYQKWPLNKHRQNNWIRRFYRIYFQNYVMLNT